MTTIKCQECEKEIPAIEGHIRFLMTQTITNTHPEFRYSTVQDSSGVIYFFCSNSCETAWQNRVKWR